MDPQLSTAITAIQAQLETLTQTVRVETRLENCNEHEEHEATRSEREEERDRLVLYQRRGEQDPDSHYLKSIRIDVDTFDGHHGPQLFLDWTQQLDKYFTWYDLSGPRKVKFVTMKLTDQASQYWTNLVNIRATHDQEPINTWLIMKDELRGKYVIPSFSARLLDSGIDILKSTNRHRSTRRNSMSFSSDVMLLTLKDKLKSYLDL